MKKTFAVFFLIASLLVIASAQKKMKPWTEWNEKEVLKVLNDSAWGQTQNVTNTAEMFYSPTAGSGTRRGTSTETTDTNDRNAQGALNQATNIAYHIRFLSARPIRQAVARQIILKNPAAAEQMKAFAEQRSNDFIVVAVDYEASDRRFSGAAMQQFQAANIGALKNNSYLETKDGKRLFLQDYKPPINDGLGAKFVFPRLMNGEPFVTAESGYVRFYSEISKEIKLNMRFKPNEMLFEGNLEL